MNNDTKMLETVKTIRDAMNTVAANTSVLYTLLIEQIGNHTVVSTDFVLPEYWYTPNCAEATEWAISHGCHFPPYKYYSNNANFGGIGNGSNYKESFNDLTPITRDQFIKHVYLPWKESLKPRYWKFIHDNSDGIGAAFERGRIYPSEYRFRPTEAHRVELIANEFPENWQPATEAEYLSQEAAKLTTDNIGEKPTPYIPTCRPDTDISNLTEPKFKEGDMVEATEEEVGSALFVRKGAIGTITSVHSDCVWADWDGDYSHLPDNNWPIKIGKIKPYTPPKFDPEKADKTKMYFATSEKWGDGIVYHRHKEWVYDTVKSTCMTISDCNHIDHEPIQRRN